MNEIRLEKASDLLIFTSNSTVRSLFFHKLDGKNVYSNFKILQKKIQNEKLCHDTMSAYLSLGR